MNTLIFADVHLKVDAANRQLLDDFVTFLREIDPEEFERVIIVGDLFDFWFEYRHVIFSGYFDVLRALADLRDRGVDFHLVCGNHDFWAGRFFENDLGFHIHHESFRCALGDKTALFLHGDGVNPDDRAYRIYRRFARSPWAIGLFRLLHPDWAMALAQRISQSSRRRGATPDLGDSREIPAIREYARRLIAAGEADWVFCGHTHHPEITECPTPAGVGLYVNTGGWLEHRTYLVWDGRDLKRFSGSLAARKPATPRVSELEERNRASL